MNDFKSPNTPLHIFYKQSDHDLQSKGHLLFASFLVYGLANSLKLFQGFVLLDAPFVLTRELPSKPTNVGPEHSNAVFQDCVDLEA